MSLVLYKAISIVTISLIVLTFVLCVIVIFSQSVKAEFDLDDVKPREYPNTSKSSERTPPLTPSSSPSASTNHSPQASTQSEIENNRSISPKVQASQDVKRYPYDWTPWFIVGGVILFIATIGSLLFLKKK